MMQEKGIKTVGIDPIQQLINYAKEQDKNGEYILMKAEKLEFPNESFDLVISYLTMNRYP